jgi:hypothetical protein
MPQIADRDRPESFCFEGLVEHASTSLIFAKYMMDSI